VGMAGKRVQVGFVEPMLLLRTENLSEGKDRLYKLKFDGYRALAMKSRGRCGSILGTIRRIRRGLFRA